MHGCRLIMGRFIDLRWINLHRPQPMTGRAEIMPYAAYGDWTGCRMALRVEPKRAGAYLQPPDCHRAVRMEPEPVCADMAPARIPDTVCVVEPSSAGMVPAVPSSRALAQPMPRGVEVMQHAVYCDRAGCHMPARVEPVPDSAN